MKALQAYRNLLRELDKFESPSFTVQDFNYFFNSAVSEYITVNYQSFDVRQKELDDIRAIVNIGVNAGSYNAGFSLPEKYRHLLHLETVLRVTANFSYYVVDQQIKVYPQRMHTNAKGFAEQNAYQRGSIEEPYYQITKGKLLVFAGSNVEIVLGAMDYIEEPAQVYLNPDKSADFNQEVNNTTLQFPDYVINEIILHCRRIFLENVESPRYGTTLRETQIKPQ